MTRIWRTALAGLVVLGLAQPVLAQDPQPPTAASGSQDPINFNVSKVTRLGKRPMSLGLGEGYFVEKPAGGASWKLRTSLTLILPK